MNLEGNATIRIMKEETKRGGLLNELDAFAVLLYIDENDEIFASDLRNVSSNYERLKRLAERMAVEGLVVVEVESTPRVKITYHLTEKGKKVAEKLREIEQVLVR